jgi:hypothetical protein
MKNQTHEAILRYLEQAIDCIKRENPAGVYAAIEASKALLDWDATYLK